MKVMLASLVLLFLWQAPQVPPARPPSDLAQASPPVTVNQLAVAMKRIEDLEARVAALEKARPAPAAKKK